jgi:hypothetical protein
VTAVGLFWWNCCSIQPRLFPILKHVFQLILGFAYPWVIARSSPTTTTERTRFMRSFKTGEDSMLPANTDDRELHRPKVGKKLEVVKLGAAR